MIEAVALSLTEAQFTTKIIDRARARGWLVHHGRPARMRDGQWRTPVQGDPGFPDLVMAKGGRLVIAELKTQTGRLRPDQVLWLTAVGVVVWRPEDWPAICSLLDDPQQPLRFGQ